MAVNPEDFGAVKIGGARPEDFGAVRITATPQEQPIEPTMAAVAVNAAGKVLPSLADSVLNAPNRLLNLGKAAIGTGMTAAGYPPAPDSMLMPNPDPNFAMRGAEKIGLVNPNVVPQTPMQKGADLLIQGGLGGAMTGGATIPRMLAGAGMGTLSAGAAGATEAVTGDPLLAATAGLIAPSAAARIPGAIASTAPSLMQSALKPTLKNLQNGNSARAIQTMLDEGVNVTPGGVMKLKQNISTLNQEIAEQIKNSTAIIDKKAVYGPLKETLDRFSKQVNPSTDISKIRAAWDEFKGHPAFEPMNQREAELIAAVAQKQESRISALQDAGRFRTMAAQQQSLANGGTFNKSPSQPSNEPYINAGVTGGVARSPSAYPVEGEPRFPPRYTSNIERVPEAQSAASETMALVRQRQLELDNAVAELDAFKKAGGAGLPVQLAQQLKTGTYRILDKKYGQVSSAEDEAQKAIARGLKEQIAAAVPEVSALNARESALLNASKLAERRVLMGGNRDQAGLGSLASTKAGFAAFLSDRSLLAKSLLARGAHSMNGLGAMMPDVAGQISPIVTQGALSEMLRQQQIEPRADGGPVKAGKPYIVGERGPEVIVPSQAGTVIPNGAPQSFDTKLSPAEEAQFLQWKAKFAPNDSGFDYDLRGAFKAKLQPDPKTGHWPDTFKKPNHPTFSNESQYAPYGNPGSWKGEEYIPGKLNMQSPTMPLSAMMQRSQIANPAPAQNVAPTEYLRGILSTILMAPYEPPRKKESGFMGGRG